MGAVLAVLFGALGGLLVLLARGAGTCTQGDAGQLVLAILAIPFHLVALGCLAASSGRLQRMVGFVLLLPVYLWQAWFGATFGLRVLIWGQSACEALLGYEYWMDGGELIYANALLFIGLGLPLAAALMLRGRQRA